LSFFIENAWVVGFCYLFGLIVMIKTVERCMLEKISTLPIFVGIYMSFGLAINIVNMEFFHAQLKIQGYSEYLMLLAQLVNSQ
jgi:hypothetical protein